MERLGQIISFSWERALEGVNRSRVQKGGDSSATMQIFRQTLQEQSRGFVYVCIYIYTHKKDVNP